MRCEAAPTPNVTQPTALILYDQTTPDDFIGGLHARMLANLLGHFSFGYDLRPMSDYHLGDIAAFDAVFYLGTSYDPPLPLSFLVDASAQARPLCWFKYNLWQLSDHLGATNFAARFGLTFVQVDASGYPEIRYRGESFSKDASDPDLGIVALEEPGPAETLAVAWKSDQETAPYAVRSGRFWYVADSPFSYTSEEDRFIVFADLLHDILDVDHPAEHKALIRLEDITPDYPTNALIDVAAVLQEQQTPFAIGLIPLYLDPLGLFNQGLPNQVALNQRPDFVLAMQQLLRAGGQILLHGYTHQYRDVPNPYSAVSGDDFEFFRVGLDEEGEVDLFEPVEEDSAEWAQERLDAARGQLGTVGLAESGWVTPHYTASPVDYAVFASNFRLAMQRGTYFDEAGHDASQIFPYDIQRDFYGQHLLPENLGNITTDQGPGEVARSVEDLLRTARKTLVVRDGWAGFFFHPFLNPEDLRQLIIGIRDLGYEFVPVTTNVPPNVCEQSPEQHHRLGTNVLLSVTTCGSDPVAYQWYRNGELLLGAESPQFMIPKLTPDDLGAYTVGLSNAFGQTLSAPILVKQLATPAILAAHVTNGVFRIWFEGQPGLHYTAEYFDFLDGPIRSRTFPVTSAGGLTSIDAPLGGLSQRFYQLLVE